MSEIAVKHDSGTGSYRCGLPQVFCRAHKNARHHAEWRGGRDAGMPDESEMTHAMA